MDIQRIFRGKFGKLGGLVFRHAVNRATQRGKVAGELCEILGLIGAAGRVRFGVKIQHERPLQTSEIDGIASAIGDGDIGQRVVYFGHISFLFKNLVGQISFAIGR